MVIRTAGQMCEGLTAMMAWARAHPDIAVDVPLVQADGLPLRVTGLEMQQLMAPADIADFCDRPADEPLGGVDLATAGTLEGVLRQIGVSAGQKPWYKRALPIVGAIVGVGLLGVFVLRKD